MESIIGFLGWLGRTSLQAAVLAVIILAVQALARDRVAPRWRHALWFLLIVRLILPWAPPSRMSVYNLFPLHAAISVPISNLSEDASGRSGLRPDSGISIAQPPSPTTATPNIGASASLPEPIGSKIRPAILIAAIWLIGFAGFIAIVVVQSFKLGAAMRGRRPVTDQRLLDLLESCKEAMGMRCWLMVIETPDAKSPALFGFVRPKLLIPAGAIEDLGPERLRHVFLHELAHLKRGDILSNWLATLLLAAHWFNPLLWYAFGRMRADQELACDHLALSCIRGDARAYGRTIVHLLEEFAKPARLPGLVGILEDPSQMKRRISMIAKFTVPARRWSVIAVLTMCLLGCIALTNASEKKPEIKSVSLRMTDFKIVPYEAGGLYCLVYSVKNNGGATCPQMRAYCYINDPSEKKTGSAGVGPIGPGDEFHEATLPFALKDGENVFKVVVDPEKTVKHPELTATLKVNARNGKLLDGPAPVAGREPFKVETTTDAEGRYVDKIDYPFVDDPRVIGQWESVDFLKDPAQFTPAEKNWKSNLYLKAITFLPEGKTREWWTWTKGLLLHDGDKTASRYEIKSIGGQNYMFLEWKSGDYVIRHQKPLYYVLRQVANTPPADQTKRVVDKIDYPFVADPDVVGRWGVVDLVKDEQQFKPGERQFQGASIVRMFEFEVAGRVKLMSAKDEAMRPAPWYRWTKGILIHQGGDHTANHYRIRRIGDKTYMFLEFKNGDYILRGAKPEYLVLEKM